MKRVFIVVPAFAVLLFFAGCGGSSNSGSTSSTSSTTTSKIKKRLLVTDTYQGQIYIIDAAQDKYLGNQVAASSSPTIMAEFPDKLHTIVVTSSGTGVSVFDNTTEAFVQSFGLPAATNSIAVSSDNKTVYAAVRNESFAGQLPGAVEIADITSTSATTTTIQVPQVRRVVLSHNGTKLLAFSDNSDQVAVMDTTTKKVTYVSGFDRPVNAVFSSD
ncbi:MAG: YncE family protein, partial [Terriglobales bacterium]